MSKSSCKPEEIVAKLRQVDVLHCQGSTIADVIRQIAVSEVTFYRWRKEYGGMKTDQLKRLKELEKENERLRRAVSDLTLDKLILKEAAKGNFWALPVVVTASITFANGLACRNDGLVACSVSTGLRSVVSRKAVRTKTASLPT